MKNGNIDITYYKPTELIAAEYNPRQLTKDQHKDLTDSIKRFGLVDPLIVNTHKERKNVLIGGHQRLKIATMLGLKEIPCVEVELNPAKEKELNIRLNKNVGEWDWDALANYFDVGELTEWGFTDDELQFYEDEPTEGLIDDDEIPEVEEAITKQGDLWLLGEHRLLCGDATKKEDVERLMDGQKADMVFTDPPYGMDFQGSVNGDGTPSANRKLKQISNETGTQLDKKEFIESWLPNILSLTNKAWYICYSRHNLRNMLNVMYEIKAPMRNMIIWNKNRQNVANTDYKPKYELILYGWENHCFYGELGDNDVWCIDKLNKAELHPTMKPIELILKAINNSSMQTNIIADLFLGSGSTLIACEKTNRKCYGMEIDPHYCDVIVKRWEEFTGNKAERVEAASA